MMARTLDLVALRSFVAVVDSGGVTRAAGLLNLTQSALSMQLKRLEEALDLGLFARAARKLTLTPEGMAGKRIGVQRATTHDKYLTDNFGSSVTIVRYGSADEAYLDLKAGRVLALLADASAIEQGLLGKEGGDKFDYVGPALTDRQWFGDGMGIAVRKGDQDLRAKLNDAIKALRANGKYQEINRKYFKYDIYGG